MESCRELKENNPYLFNSWRSILYTEKGRKAGVVDEWRKFPTFYKDVHETYKEGLRLCRKDKNKPFGPNNFEWVTNLELAQTNTQTIKLTYNGETKTLREWSEEYGMSYNGLLLRTDHSFNTSKIKDRSIQFYYQSIASESPFTIPSYIIRVSGLKDGQVLNYRISNPVNLFQISQDGVYTLPSFEFAAKGAFYGFQFNKPQESCNITIEQIPEYEGALVFDGVDDYGICEDFPALKDFTFVYKRINLNPSKSTNCFLSKSVSTNQAQQFCSELAYSQNIYVRLGGKDIAVKDIYNPELSIVYVTKESYNGEMNLASSNYTSTVDDLYIGTFSRGIQAYVWKGALYALDIYDRTLNSDELQIALQNIEK